MANVGNLILGCAAILMLLASLETALLFAGDVTKQWKHPVLITYLQLSACIIFAPFAHFQKEHFTITDIKHASISAFVTIQLGSIKTKILLLVTINLFSLFELSF